MFHRRTRITHLLALILTLFMLLSLTACGIHFHKWEAASCISAKKCSGCGKTQGEPLVHQVPQNGICTLCKRQISNVLTLDKEARPTTTVVYGGVFLRVYLKYSGMFPTDYTIYAEDGTQIAAGDWGKIDWVKISENFRESPEYVDTEYLALPPGNYRVAYTYYPRYVFDWDLMLFVPDPDYDPVFVDGQYFTIK